MAAFEVPLTVLVGLSRTDLRHRGTLQLPCLVPPALGPPPAAVLARLFPLLRAHGDALAAQTEGLDPERLSRTYAALIAALQEAAGMRVNAVALTPYTLRDVLPACGEGLDYRAWPQLVELPEGLRALAGELRALKVESERLAEVPDEWVGELTRLEVLHISKGGWLNTELRALPSTLGQLGTLKKLLLSGLATLEEMPDTLGSLTSLESLTIADCPKLKALPASIMLLSRLQELRIDGLSELEEMPDTLGSLTSLESLTIADCPKLKTLPASIMLLLRLQELKIGQHGVGLSELQEMPDTLGSLTSLESLTIAECPK